MSAGAAPASCCCAATTPTSGTCARGSACATSYDVAVLVTGSNVHQVAGLDLEVVPVRTPRDALPGDARRRRRAPTRSASATCGLDAPPGRRRHRARAPRSGRGSPRRRRGCAARLGFKLALTVWETIAVARDLPLAARARLPARACWPRPTSSSPTTERARDALLLEGVAPERIDVCPPGIDLDHFAAAPPRRRRADGTASCRPGGWCGRRATRTCCARSPRCAAAWPGPARADVELLIVGDGPERRRLERYARELGVADARRVPRHRPLRRDARALRVGLGARARQPARRAAGRSSSAWCWSRRWRPARRSSPARRARSRRCSAATGTLVAAGRLARPRAGAGRRRRRAAPAARAEVDRARLERYSSAGRGRAPARGLRRAARARRALAEAPARARRGSRRARRRTNGAPALGERQRLEEEDGEDRASGAAARSGAAADGGARTRRSCCARRSRARGSRRARRRSRPTRGARRRASGTNHTSKPAARARSDQSTSST